jgi:hypothetical protein
MVPGSLGAEATFPEEQARKMMVVSVSEISTLNFVMAPGSLWMTSCDGACSYSEVLNGINMEHRKVVKR